MKYALFDEAGFPLGFYDENIHGALEIDGTPNPATRIPSDAVAITDAQWVEFLEHQGRRKWQDGTVIDYDSPAPPLTVDDYQRAIQSHVDTTARSRSYDSGNSLAGYVASTNPVWAAEAQAFVAWRDAVWIYAYAELDKVIANQRAVPTVEDFIAELPVMVWPT